MSETKAKKVSKKAQKTTVENSTAIPEVVAEKTCVEDHPVFEGNLPLDEEQRLADLKDKYGKTPLEITNMYNEAYATLVGKATKANIERLAVNMVANKLGKEQRKKEYKPKNTAKIIIGFVMGDRGIFDKIAVMKAQAKKHIKEKGIE